MKRFVLCALAPVLALSCRDKEKVVPTVGPDPTPPAAAVAVEPKAPSIVDRVTAAPDWRAAFVVAQPEMESAAFGKDSDGTMLFALWSIRHLTWPDVSVSENETSVARVMKDDDAERGKRFCADISLIQIEAQKIDRETKFDVGLMQTGAGNLIRFFGVGTSGDLVENSHARFCGVMTGRYDYANSGGGTGHAAAAVGMFDLPQNRRMRATSAAAPAAPGPCDPPYSIDGEGRKVFKVDCLPSRGR